MSFYKLKTVRYLYILTLLVGLFPTLQLIYRLYLVKLNEITEAAIPSGTQVGNLQQFDGQSVKQEYLMPNKTKQRRRKSKPIIKKRSKYASNHSNEFPNLVAPKFLMQPNYTCWKDGEGVKILILVTSAARNVGKRRSIRFTWGSFTKRKDVELAFVLGLGSNEIISKQVFSENSNYGDIVQCDFADTYNNLTLKTMCAIRFFEKSCPKAAFLMKCDDDVFVIIKNLLMFLETKQNHKLGIWGDVLAETEPFRNNNSKYFISKELYPDKLFPKYIAGPAYIMTRRSAILLSQNAENEIYYHIEDMFFTGLLAEKLRIPRMRAAYIIHNKPRGVQLGRVIAQHHCNPNEMFSLWAYFNTHEHLLNKINPFEDIPICRGP